MNVSQETRNPSFAERTRLQRSNVEIYEMIEHNHHLERRAQWGRVELEEMCHTILHTNFRVL